MANSSIAEAWLRSINSSKQDKDTSRKELRDENTAFTQGTKEVSGQISEENNPTIDRQKNFLLSQSRFKAINFSNSHDDLRNKSVENFNSVLEQLQLRRARSEKDISENDSDESVSQAQVWLRPTSYIKSEKNTLEKEFGEDNSKRQARFSANFVPKVENSIPDNLIYGNIGQDRLKAANVPKSEKDSPSKDFTGVRALVREINASKSEQEKTTGDKFRGQTRFKAVISPTSEAGNSGKDIVAVRARVKEINDIKPGKKSTCLMKDAGEKDFQAHKTSTLSFAVPKLSSSKEKSRVFDDQKTFLKDDVITLYRDLEKILRSENCDKDLISILDKSNPGILKILEKRREDMEKPDHSIVIAGETSSGKSTLINKIIGKKIFKGKILESTATVCKLRNSEKVKIIVEYTSGKPNEVRDMQLKYNPDTEEGRKKLREVLKQLTDISVSKEIDDIECVDVGFPIPFLKDGIVLVDTPGIGGSGEFNKKVIEYIPNAEVFIFVINVYNAGGMQGDRLPKILKEIVLKQMDNEMPCFDPKNVLFITNKRDLVKKEKEENDSDSSDDENATKIWEKLLSNIKEKWPSVKGDHIFKMSLKEISPDKLNPSVTQFGKFMETLKLDIENAEKTRAGYHFRFLQQLLRDITKGLQTKLELNKMSEETEHALLKKQEENIRTISQDCTKVREKLLRNVKEQIEATTKSCHDYLSSAIGKEQIFNFEGVDKLLAWNPRFVSKRVKTNVCKYVENLLNSEDVKKRFDQVKDETISYYEKVYLEVHVMENDWMHGIREGTKGNESEQPFSPVWLLLLAAEVGLRLVCTGVTVPLDPDNFSLNNSLGRDAKIKLFTNSSDYDNFMSKVCGAVSNHLESTACAVLTKLIDKITLELLPRRIQYSVEVLRQIKESRVNILEKRSHLLKLESNVRALEEKVKAIEKYFN